MTPTNSRSLYGWASPAVLRILDLLLSTAQNQRLALDLLQRHWSSVATPAGVLQPKPDRKARAANPTPLRPIPTAEIGAQVLRALQALAATGRLRVNEPSGHLYIHGEHIAVVPDALRAVRSYLAVEGGALPPRIYEELHAQSVLVASDTGRFVRRLDVRVGTTWRATDVRALLLPRTRLDGLAAYAGFDDVAFTEIPPAVSTGVHSAGAEGVVSAPTAEEPVTTAAQPDLYGYEAHYDARPSF